LLKEIGVATKQDQLRKLYYETIRNDGEHKGCCDCHEMMRTAGFNEDDMATFVALPPKIEIDDINYIFVAKEPTTDWTHPESGPTELIDRGMYGFGYVNPQNRNQWRPPFLLKYAINRYLCNNQNNYLLTDLGKCCMPLDNNDAIKKTPKRFENCKQWLDKEIEIVKPKQLFGLGGAVCNKLKQFNIGLIPLPHYSAAANGVFQSFAKEYNDDYTKFLEEYAPCLHYDINLYINSEHALLEKESALKQVKETLELNRTDEISGGDLRRLFLYKYIFEKYVS